MNIEQTRESVKKVFSTEEKASFSKKYGKDNVGFFFNAFVNYIYSRKLLTQIRDSRSIAAALTSSLATGTAIDGINANIVVKGGRCVFIPSYKALQDLVYSKYKKILIPKAYYKPQIDFINREPMFEESVGWGNVNAAEYMSNTRNVNAPTLIQVGFSKETYRNLWKSTLDQKAGIAQKTSSAWKEHGLAMYEKTAIKAFIKYLDFSDMMDHIYNIEEDAAVKPEEKRIQEREAVKMMQITEQPEDIRIQAECSRG